MSAPASGPGARQASFRFIFALAVMNAISFGIMIPVLPNLIKAFTGGDTAAASEWNVVFATAWGLMQFIIGPILGLMSDRYGRRPVLLLSLFGLAVDFLFMALAPSLWWLFLGRVLNGMTAASFSAANAYIADVTPPQDRARAFGLMGSAFSFGFIVGPAFGGALGEISLRLPFLVAAGLTLANWLYGYFILPESLPPEKRIGRFDWRRVNPVGSLRLLRSAPGLVSLASIGLLFQLAHMVLPTIFVLYTGHRYGWGPGVVGLVMVLTGVLGVIVQSFLIGPVVKRIGERNAVLLGAFCGAVGFAWYGWAPTGWLYLGAAPVFALMGFLLPGLQALMTRRLGPSQQGQLQGANASLQGVAAILGPVIFGGVFAWSLRQSGWAGPGLAIYLAAAMMGLAFILALGTAKSDPQPASALP